MNRISTRDLIRLWNLDRSKCCKCGITLESWNGPLGQYFVLDKNGNYYCMGCDHIFEEGDHRIFELDLVDDEITD